jgi:hypothetical protein
LNTPDSSVEPGGYLSIYGTGFTGYLLVPIADGHPAQTEPLPFYHVWPAAKLGIHGYAGSGMEILYSGRAPGLVGVDQVVARVPENAPEGCNVALQIGGSTYVSQPVSVSIRRGGGACQDPAPASTGYVRWQRTTVSGPDPASVTQTDALSASFVRAAPKLIAAFEEPIIREGNCGNVLSDREERYRGLRCMPFGMALLDAGRLTPGSATGSAAVGEAFNASTLENYTSVLPNGAMNPGTVTISAAGGRTSAASTRALRSLRRFALLRPSFQEPSFRLHERSGCNGRTGPMT